MKFASPSLKMLKVLVPRISDVPKLSEFQFRELSKYWFDLSKLTVASLILKFFEPEARWLESFSPLIALFGLTFSALFAIVGLRFAREVEKK